MVSKRALDLGHIRFGQEVSMAEVVEVENVETQDCEFISEKMSEAPFSTQRSPVGFELFSYSYHQRLSIFVWLTKAQV